MKISPITRRGFLRGALAATAAAALPGPLVGCGGDETFTLVALPDTQNYANEYPAVYMDQTRWIAEHRESHNILFVTHLGDIVDNGPNLRQWGNAKKAMQVLDSAGVPYGTCLGNHDLMYQDSEYSWPKDVDHTCSDSTNLDCAGKDYLAHFGPTLYKDRPWYGGASPSGLSNYQTLSFGGVKFLFLHLSVDPRAAEKSWAQGVLDNHRDHMVHVSTHRYMYDYRLVKSLPHPLNKFGGGRMDSTIHGMMQPVYFKDASTADDLFKSFIAKNKNIFMVQCGHVDAEFRQVSKNDAGLPVHEMLVDFQTSEAKGGNGWMRLLNFNLTRGEVSVSTYSPTLKRHRRHEDALEASLEVFLMAFTSYGKYLSAFIGEQETKRLLNYWGNDPAGRKEFHSLLFDEGHRDSAFTLNVDFGAYT